MNISLAKSFVIISTNCVCKAYTRVEQKKVNVWNLDERFST